MNYGNKISTKGQKKRNQIIRQMEDGPEKEVMKIIHEHFPKLVTTETLLAECAKRKICDENGKKIKTFSDMEKIFQGLDLGSMVSISDALAQNKGLLLGNAFYYFAGPKLDQTRIAKT